MNLILLIELIGVPVIFLGGSAFHFIYKYGGKKNWMAIFSPVNESIWEHLKIAFYPSLIYSLVQFLIIGPVFSNYLTAEVIGIYCMFLFILIAEFIYPAILKKNILIIDLIVFFLAILISQLVSYIVFSYPNIKIENYFVFLIILLQVVIFTLFSFKPPKFWLFRDSVDGKYGIK